MQDVGVVIRPRISSYPENARSNRAPATNSRTSGPSWGQHKGADDPCKIVVVGALPTVSTNSFPSSHLGEGGRLLTGEAWFETRGGSHFTRRSSSGQGPQPLKLVIAGSNPARRTNCSRSSTGGAPDYGSGRCRFDSCRELQSSACVEVPSS